MNIDRVSGSTCQQPISGEYVKKSRIHRGQYSVKIECKVFAAPPALGAIGVASIQGVGLTCMTCRPRDPPANSAITAPHYAGRILNMGYSNNLRHFSPHRFRFPSARPFPFNPWCGFPLTRDRLTWAWKFLSRENLWDGIGFSFLFFFLISSRPYKALDEKFCKFCVVLRFFDIFSNWVIDNISLLLVDVFTIIHDLWLVDNRRVLARILNIISSILANKTKRLVTFWKKKG